MAEDTRREAAAEAPEKEHAEADGAKSRFVPSTRVSEVTIVRVSSDLASALVNVGGKELRVSRRSLFLLPLEWRLRQRILAFAQWKVVDRFILCCILLNSVLLATYQWRPNAEGVVYNEINSVISDILTGIFIAECALKVCAWGFVLDPGSYLRDPWNVMDFVVVVSGIIEWIPFIETSSLSFLRLFRVLRPLRSLKAYPEMQTIVNTTVSAIPKLGNVSIMGLFIYLVFAIVGITLMPGVFYRRCRETANPWPCYDCEPGGCWQWNYTGTASAGRLCGGRYMCEPGEFCRGHPEDVSEDLRPVFVGALPIPGMNGRWCAGSEPAKFTMVGLDAVGVPEADFVHFDNLAGAFLLVFQCMTMEGWTDIMYYMQDGYGTWVARIYFILLVIFTSYFLLNVALAVVDEAREEFQHKQEGDHGPSLRASEFHDIGLWWDNRVVEFVEGVTSNEAYSNFILLVITGNVVTMMLEKFPPDISQDRPLFIANVFFMVIFCVEMALELIARGPRRYVRDPTTSFDGLTTLVSIIEMATGGQGGLKALRTLRLFRVLNKLAKRFPALGVMMTAMVGTARDLKYWLVLFLMSLCIFTLMLMNFFANEFHFEESDAPAEVFAKRSSLPGQLDAWCPGTTDEQRWNDRQDCIPRAHFDTFVSGLVTVFQVMTGENWNTIMYSGMRAGGWPFCALFVFLILFGQTLFLSLFLSMLISKFSDFQEDLKSQACLNSTALSKCSNSSLSPNGEASPRPAEGDAEQERGSSPSRVVAVHEHQSEVPSSDCESSEKGLYSIAPTPAPSAGCLPGLISESLAGAELPLPESDPTCLRPPSRKEPDVEENDVDDGIQELEDALAGPRWPRGYSWFVLSTSNPVRRAAQWILTVDAHGLDAQSRKQRAHRISAQVSGDFPRSSTWTAASQRTNAPPQKPSNAPLVFDNFILVCILLSTVSMMVDGPLEDGPPGSFIWHIRRADDVFAVIFIIEMAVKLLAYPLVWGENAYLWSPGCGWNWLDAVVVLVSVIGFVTADGPSFLKTLRLLRAFRPLRLINRNKNLKIVIETTFKSMQALGWLLVVFLLFLLIFALMCLMFLKGQLEACEGEGVAFLRDAGQDFSTPMCFAGNFSQQRESLISGEGSANGAWDAEAHTWLLGTCAAPRISWRRASADTPICLGACDPMESSDSPRPAFCPPRYQTTEELPSLCGTPLPPGDPGLIGEAFVSEMQRLYTVPCGGSTAASATIADRVDDAVEANSSSAGAVATAAGNPAAAVSCRQAFCPHGVSQQKAERCDAECIIHPYFCVEVCAHCIADGQVCNGACLSCRMECQAACECDEFCRPVSKDAALCHEQGGQWKQVIGQNFNNIVNSMLTLLEISTTEGWVDVMYAAGDSIDIFVQPLRDTSLGYYAPLFVIWIFLSFMFLLNLGVGVIVDKFMTMRRNGQDFMLTETQARWKKTRKHLYDRGLVYNLTNLHLLPRGRRRIYDFVESAPFENTIMMCIVVNTILMGMRVFPNPTAWWDETLAGLNYFFAAVYTVEAVLKLLAYRLHYFWSRWNCFDFFCVSATFVGFGLQFGFPAGPDLGPVMSVLRIFRIARLFRLLKFMKSLNRLFSALMLSVPRLVNVVGILLLLLVLFSILGVQLFATAKTSETLNDYGNFQDFWRGFATLFRASTGEAWNEIMHDLGKGEIDFFREGTWCAPADLYDWQSRYDTLRSKCLIENPNSCVQTLWGWNVLPYVYWVGYILLIGQVVMNLVISVILDGYEEGKEDTSYCFDVCKSLWPKFDPDLRMAIPLGQAVRFIWQATCEVAGKEIGSTPADMARIPMKFAKALDLLAQGPDAQVHFTTAARQVLRFLAVLEHHGPGDIIEELDATDLYLSRREAKRLAALEGKFQTKKSFQFPTRDAMKDDMTLFIAATKLQRKFRDRKAWAAYQQTKKAKTAPGKVGELKRQPSGVSGGSASLLPAPSVEDEIEELIVPPVAG